MIIERASVRENRPLAEGIFQMTMTAPAIANENPSPGQFLNISVTDDWLHPLRRPMSIAGRDEDNLTIIYKLFGEGTRLLSQYASGNSLDVLGPLGNSFGTTEGTTPVLVGGGVGLAPILWLHEILQSKSVDHVTIIGARHAGEHFLEHRPDEGVILTSDDGSLGLKGTVMNPVGSVCSELDVPKLFACGPEPMLIVVKDFAITESIAGELSVESYMGCATGICQGCVIERQNGAASKHSYHDRYSLVCLEGPVYNAEDICFA